MRKYLKLCFILALVVLVLYLSLEKNSDRNAKENHSNGGIDELTTRHLSTSAETEKEKTTKVPTFFPTKRDKTSDPTKAPTLFPTEKDPTSYPTSRPTKSPVELTPTEFPTKNIPTPYPTRRIPTISPRAPTFSPTYNSTSSPTKSPTVQRPNIILIIADDVGYFDVGAHGNKIVQTPYLDKLRAESVRLDDFHMYPTCSASRAALLTGRFATRSGVWHTIQFRNIINSEEKTLAEVLSENGWSTALIGKWHLGDNYPSRAIDKGFQRFFGFPGGGIGQTPDFWGNNNFNPTFIQNGQFVQKSGFSTNILFDEAISLLSTMAEPFFIMIAPNAAHAPQNAPSEDKDLYSKYPLAAAFYGMITNMDRNIKRLDEALESLNMRRNTIFIFTTDNGSACGPERCPWSSRGSSGFKSSVYEGGHRVPFFIRWPKAGIVDKTINSLTMCIDVFPTLLDLSLIRYIPNSESRALDGSSFKRLLLPSTGTSEDLEVTAIRNNFNQRVVVIEDQRMFNPEKWKATVVLYNKWRYIKPKLFDLSKDPYQEENVASKNKDIVSQIENAYNNYWNEMESKYLDKMAYIAIGTPYENPVNLNAMDWIASLTPPWEQDMIAEETGAKYGYWYVRIFEEGNYDITARKYPAESKKAINSGTIKIDSAVFEHNGQRYRERVSNSAESVVFRNVRLSPGYTKFSVAFNSQGVTVLNAYYVSVLFATQSPTTSSPTIPVPTVSPTTRNPTRRPTVSPTTPKPTTRIPTFSPVPKPSSKVPTISPSTKTPTNKPTTLLPTSVPTTRSPTTTSPTSAPQTKAPSNTPSHSPSEAPTTSKPTTSAPTLSPTEVPTSTPTTPAPTFNPITQSPTTRSPTQKPTTNSPTTTRPTLNPTTKAPTIRPSRSPTIAPTSKSPTAKPSTKKPSSLSPTSSPTDSPSISVLTSAPTSSPNITVVIPTESPASINITSMTSVPTFNPTQKVQEIITLPPTIYPSTISNNSLAQIPDNISNMTDYEY